jgi:DNA mismatch repair protein MutS
MGARLLRRWLGQPLLNLQPLLERQNAVQCLHENTIQRQQVRNLLHKMPDVERLLSRIVSGVANPRDVVALRFGLELLPQLEEALGIGVDFETNQWSRLGLGTFPDIVTLIANALVDDPGMIVGEGRVIRSGFSKELDDVRFAANDAREYLALLERRERERTGITSLKVGYNRVFGYYLEVSNANIHRVPQEYIRRQTLVGGERFITPELKEYESKVLSAREKLEELEQILYRQVCTKVAAEAGHIITTAAGIGRLDVLASLAEIAIRNDYVKPDLNESTTLSIMDGRHPVIEQTLPPGTFVTNDTNLDNDDIQLMMLTGPNMSGKSTYIRQVAIIVLMAQIGSYVPAREAVVGLVDRVFTRVGLQDDLVTGQSTFMVEMVETAAILHNATERSLVVLDEIGRGTSTYDGLAIAWAVAEYLHDAPRLGCKTLFATHYHELVELAKTLTRVGNYNVAVVEEEGEVIFLHRILPGATGRSYGVHVAKLAGLPVVVTTRAQEILDWLEDAKTNEQKKRLVLDRPEERTQLPLFEPRYSIVDDLLNLDLSVTTPLEALNKLSKIQDQLRTS